MRFTVQMMVALLVAVALSACDSEAPEQPNDVFMSFLMHHFRGETQLAFELIAPADRAALTAPLKDAGSDLEPWQMLVVAEFENLYDVAKVEASEKFEGAVADGTAVTLTVHRTDGTQIEVAMVHEGGRWYIDLPLEGAG